MFEIVFKIWYMIAILPFIVFLEGNKMFSDFLKKKNIYYHWDVFHSFLFILIIIFIIFWIKSYR